MACCEEWGCARNKPIQLMQSGLTQTWYCVTDYEAVPDVDGLFESLAKHRVPDELGRLLTAWKNAYDKQHEEVA